MHLKFFGTRGVFPTSEQMISFLVTCENGKILLDAGSTSIFSGSNEYKNLDYILLTHHHNDHTAMLPHLVLARLFHKQPNEHDKPLNIISPEPITDILQTMGIEKLSIIQHSTYVPVSILGINLEYIETEHSRKNYCYKLTTNTHSLVYTGDTTYFPELAEFCKGVDLLVCEASYEDRNSQYAKLWGHMTPKMVAELIDKANPKTTILTHFVEMEGALFAKAIRTYLNRNTKIIYATEGLEIHLK